MGNDIHDKERLKELQALPLDRKIQITQTRIIEWYQHYDGNVCVSLSGGKDSTVLLHIARKIYPDMPAVFSNTGLEYPEIQKFVKGFRNVDIVIPKMNFGQVITAYGYPLISKEVAQDIYEARKPSYKRTRSKFDVNSEYCLRYGERYQRAKWLPLLQLPILISHLCCSKIKKSPLHEYSRTHNGAKQIVATLAEESNMRRQAWLHHGCNAFDSKIPTSQPMSFWKEQDVLTYIVKYADSIIEMRKKTLFERVGTDDIGTLLASGLTLGQTIERDYSSPIASVYGDIVSIGKDGNSYPAIDVAGNVQPNLKCTECQRTGCIFCAFGAHCDKGETRFQRLAKTHPRQYEYCIGGGEWIDNPFYDPTAPKYDGEWLNWNPKKIWSKNGKGLGMGKVFDLCNEAYGKDFIKY